jgi:hypothetical protein
MGEIDLADKLVAAGIAVIGYFLHYHFSSIKKSIRGIKDTQLRQIENIAKLEGKIEILNKSLDVNSIALRDMTRDVRALWRGVDGAHQRASDLKAQNG